MTFATFAPSDKDATNRRGKQASKSLVAPLADEVIEGRHVGYRCIATRGCAAKGARRSLARLLLGRQLLISLKVSNIDRTATKERMILHVRPPERQPPSPDTPAARIRRA
jgi:hypothetical protein